MVNTDEIQVAHGPRSLAREQCFKRRGTFFYSLRRLKKSQSQGGPVAAGQTRGSATPPLVVVPGGLRCPRSPSRPLWISDRIRWGLRVPSCPLRISDRTWRGIRAQFEFEFEFESRPTYWTISVGRWRSFSAYGMPYWAPETRREGRRSRAPFGRVCSRNCRRPIVTLSKTPRSNGCDAHSQ